MKSLKKFLLMVTLGAMVAAGVFYFRDTQGPVLNLMPSSGPISAKTPLLLGLTDDGLGLKNVQVTVIQNGNRLPLANQTFPPQTGETQVQLNLAALKIKDGPIQVEVLAGDQSIYHLGKGNSSQQLYNLSYDTRPPIISTLSKAHNLTKGGSGLVSYRLNEEVEETGLKIGEQVFPAFLQEDGVYVSLFAYPYNMRENNFVPRIYAVDLAGNERQSGIYYRANNKKFRKRKINLSQNFLQQKTPEFEPLVPEVGEPIDTFLYVNREIRQQNREKMVELAKNTAASPLWQGKFLRMPRSSELALFADYRSYHYKGKQVDEAVHLGYDLASVAQAEVPVANHGEVVWADYLGIYGLCIVIDHGLGLQTLYAHMSQLEVQLGDTVVRGQILGRSGATGMAGGDHLHYGVFVSGIAVQPLEWWDAKWLENNIDSKLRSE